MKTLYLLLALITLTLCEDAPKTKLIGVEDAFVEVKKRILECITKSETASAELKKYATDFLATDLKESLNLKKFRENTNDKDVIRKCRRDAFLKDTMRKPINSVSHNKRFLAKKIAKHILKK